MSSNGPSDYAAIREDHKRRYGTDIAEYGPRLFEEQYADPRHFLLELLQNAEDALGRRQIKPPVAERAVSFDLTEDALRVSHFGDPFNSADVKSICGIGRSTKGRENIGRFGLGFKSVYAFTDRPEIHSGPEDFVIRNYVWPEAAAPETREDHETVIRLPGKSESADWESLAAGLPRMLSGPYLLFLRCIESVRWSMPGGSEAEYLRQSEEIEAGIRRVTLIGGDEGSGASCDEDWLIFERPVHYKDRATGCVEIAFAINSETPSGHQEFPIHSLSKPSLYVFFPTDKETHLGFHVQGPYNTTPARDNVKWPDSWNAYLVSETASLLRSALGWFRDRGGVSVSLLNCLPLEEAHFTGTMFLPLFEETRTALRDDGLLPTESGPFASASQARLGRGERLRRLFSPEELGALCGLDESVHWLPGEITADRAPMLRQYLQKQLEIEELDPESVVNRLTGAIPWPALGCLDSPALRIPCGPVRICPPEVAANETRSPIGRWKAQMPALRGTTHGCSFPGETKTGFPTVGESVCHGAQGPRVVWRFWASCEPDLVADVVENVLRQVRRWRN